MDNPIASRVLNCVVDGKTQEVVVRLGSPQKEEDYFICQYEISLLGKNERYKIAGLDSVHALQLAIFMVGSMLHSLPGASNWTWNGEPFTGLPTSLNEPIVGLRS
jgi:hypothetical protein